MSSGLSSDLKRTHMLGKQEGGVCWRGMSALRGSDQFVLLWGSFSWAGTQASLPSWKFCSQYQPPRSSCSHTLSFTSISQEANFHPSLGNPALHFHPAVPHHRLSFHIKEGAGNVVTAPRKQDGNELEKVQQGSVRRVKDMIYVERVKE